MRKLLYSQKTLKATQNKLLKTYNTYRFVTKVWQIQSKDHEKL